MGGDVGFHHSGMFVSCLMARRWILVGWVVAMGAAAAGVGLTLSRMKLSATGGSSGNLNVFLVHDAAGTLRFPTEAESYALGLIASRAVGELIEQDPAETDKEIGTYADVKFGVLSAKAKCRRYFLDGEVRRSIDDLPLKRVWSSEISIKYDPSDCLADLTEDEGRAWVRRYCGQHPERSDVPRARRWPADAFWNPGRVEYLWDEWARKAWKRDRAVILAAGGLAAGWTGLMLWLSSARRARAAGRCRRCGYSVAGLTSMACPECGSGREEAKA